MTAALANTALILLIWLIAGVALTVWLHLINRGLDAARRERDRRFIADTEARMRRARQEQER